jgi:hypothetical protein
VAHLGRQHYTGSSASVLSYTDWKLGLTRDFSGYVVGLAYTGSNASDAGYTIRGKNIGRSQVVLSLNKTSGRSRPGSMDIKEDPHHA